MKKVTIREIRQVLSHLNRILESKGELTITRRGKAIARLVSVGMRKEIPSHKSLRASIPLLRKGSKRLVREDRDGRWGNGLLRYERLGKVVPERIPIG